MNVRAQAVGMAAQSQNVANAIFQQFFPTFLKNCGFYAFYFFAGINFLLAVFVFFFIPETKQVKLEEIDTLFGGANHIEKGATILGLESRNPSMVAPARDHNRRSEEIGEAQHLGARVDEKNAVSQVENTGVRS